MSYLDNIDVDVLKRKLLREHHSRLEAEALLETKTKELYLLNKKLEQKVVDEVEKNKQNEMLLFRQAKLASMGEMLSNVAHQWRQPLSAITSSSSGISLEYDFKTLDKEKVDYYTNKIMENAQYLSQTIDVFSNFFKDDIARVKRKVSIEIDEALKIVSNSMKDSNIELRNFVFAIMSSPNELSQVLINILNNAKDAINQNKSIEKWIELKLFASKERILITVEDSGGGVSEKIKEKIFEPYFTTKNETSGAGLGLHMCYRIIKEKLEGHIDIKNTESGAKFYIDLEMAK